MRLKLDLLAVFILALSLENDAGWGYTLSMIYAEAILWILFFGYWVYRLILQFRAQGIASLYPRSLLFSLLMGVVLISFGKDIYIRLLMQN